MQPLCHVIVGCCLLVSMTRADYTTSLMPAGRNNESTLDQRSVPWSGVGQNVCHASEETVDESGERRAKEMDTSLSAQHLNTPLIDRHTLAYLQQVIRCQTEGVVVIGDRHSPSYPALHRKFLEYVTSLSIPLVHIEVHTNMSIRDDITNGILWRELENYQDRRLLTSYILFSSLAGEILVDVEKGFLEHSRESRSIFSHRSKWLIFVTSHAQKLELTRKLKKCILDNIAFILYSQSTTNETMSDGEPWQPDMVTLMWREHRTRGPQEVNMEEVTKSTECILFPNIHFGLNQRKLTAVGRTDYFLKLVNDSTKPGSKRFESFGVLIIGYLSEYMNFTFDILPQLNEQPTNMSWSEIEVSMMQGKYNMGANMWFLSRRVSGLMFSFPVVFDRLVGVYKREAEKKDPATLIVYPFKPTTFAMIGGSILYCICFYMAIRLVLCTRHIDEDVGHQPEIDQSNPDTESPEDRLVSPNRQLSQSLTLITSILQSFLWGQYFPRPRLMSSRIVLCLMSLSTVIYYALYTGVLTATITSFPKRMRYKSWEELLLTDGYQCRVLTNPRYANILQHEDQFCTINVLSKLCKDDYSPDDNMADILIAYLKTLEEKKVVLLHEMMFDDIKHHLDNNQNLYKFPKRAMDINNAFFFPFQSEIEPLVSKALMSFHATPFTKMDPFIKRRSGKILTHLIFDSDERVKKNNKIVLTDFKWLVVTTAALTLLSCVVLMAEYVVMWAGRKKLERMARHNLETEAVVDDKREADEQEQNGEIKYEMEMLDGGIPNRRVEALLW